MPRLAFRLILTLVIATSNLVLSGVTADADCVKLTPEEIADGWILLFDGHTTKGWSNSNLKLDQDPIEDGALTPYKRGAYYLMTDRVFADFVLSVDFKTSDKCNSGIFLRADPKRGMKLGNDTAWYAFEVAIDEAQESGHHATGALYDLVPVKKNLSKPVGEWNRARITCDRSLVRVEINGQVVSETDLDQWPVGGKRPDGTSTKFNYPMKPRARSGFIGLQDHGQPVWFKNIKIKPLHEEGFQSLFDGRSLDAWTARTAQGKPVALDKSSFGVTDDFAIECNGEEGAYWIVAPGGPYGDFTLRLEYRVDSGTNSGIFMRSSEDGHPAFTGLECQIIDDSGKEPSDKWTTGAIFDVVTPMRNASRAVGEWNEVEITMKGRHYVGFVNGFKVIDIDFDDPIFGEPIGKFKTPYNQLPLEGHIGLQSHGGKIWFRNLRVKRLQQ
jgi:hypothetical protein